MTDGTAIGALKAALSSRVEEKTLTLRVPKTDVYVKYRAFTQQELKRIRDRFLKPGKEHSAADIERAGLKVNPALLAETCEGIYVMADGALQSADPEGDAPTFDNRLVELLGESEQESASAIAKLLYGQNDFDIAAAVAAVSQFSGGAEAEVYEDASGN